MDQRLNCVIFKLDALIPFFFRDEVNGKVFIVGLPVQFFQRTDRFGNSGDAVQLCDSGNGRDSYHI